MKANSKRKVFGDAVDLLMLRNLRLIILMNRRMVGMVMSTICLPRPIQDRIGVK